MPTPCQPTILADPPRAGLALVFGMHASSDPRPALRRLNDAALTARVIGLGAPLVRALGADIPGLRSFPALAGAGVAFPSTQGALWAFLAGDDPGELLGRGRRLQATLGPELPLVEEVPTFKFAGGRDLTGFEDGTENPKGDAALEAAFVAGREAGVDGSSFVAVQRYRHDLPLFEAIAPDARDLVIGRRHANNEEIADAPPSAHVKRSAQESFDPPAFMLRRSMPWGGVAEQGLYFVAYGAELDRFERVLTRMAGLEDGIVDALLSYSTALSGGYYWCPPMIDGRLDLSRAGV